LQLTFGDDGVVIDNQHTFKGGDYDANP
jgi:hypothetical protein